MKKTIALVLALVFALSLTVAFAENDAQKAAWVASKTNAVRTMFDTEGYKYDYSSDRNRFKATFSINSEMKEVTVWTFINYDLVEFNADYPVNAPEDKVDEVAVFFTRINEFFRIGQFYMGYEDGLMGYKVVVYTEEADPTQDCLYWALRLSVREAEIAGDALNDLLTGAMTLDEAVAAVDSIING